MNNFIGGDISINQSKRIVVIGDKVIPFHEKMTGNNITTINGESYIDGYEYKNGEWKRTLKALWYMIF
ncbi:hypothetical protein [Priestia aryabhattai]|uniref:hypothetical protein n=1 Tax=Priestia aryabhattai TaxID=412384 RepID=UPI0015F6534D|nr:hypothetical protein [Priestia aryabhattai]